MDRVVEDDVEAELKSDVSREGATPEAGEGPGRGLGVAVPAGRGPCPQQDQLFLSPSLTVSLPFCQSRISGGGSVPGNQPLCIF